MIKEVQGSVKSIAFGGDGIIKDSNKVIFVPFVAPNEVIKAHIKQDKKSFAKAELVKIITPSPNRVVPSCSYFSVCGGCHLQHISYEEQLNIKRAFVKDALLRIGDIDVAVNETIPSVAKLYYRKHIKLQIQNSNLGYVRHDLQNIVSIDSCSIFGDESSDIILQLKSLIYLFNDVSELHIYQDKQHSYVIYLVALKKISKEVADLIMQKIPFIKGVLISYKQSYKYYGDCELYTEINNLKISYNPLVFMQANKEQSQNIMLKLLELINLHNCQNIIDLYCGIGISSLLLKKAGCNVIAIEINPCAILAAQKNALLNDITDISWHTMDASKFDSLDLNKFLADTIVINPPRIGISKELINKILQLNIKNIFYISCMPSTLARDIKELKKYYHVDYCQPFDMFPQTTHVETLIHLTKRS